VTLSESDDDSQSERLTAPKFVGLSPQAALRKGRGLAVTVKGDCFTGNIFWQSPAAGETIVPGAVVAVQAQQPFTEGAQGFRIPDVTGMTANQAALLLTRLHVKFTLDGVGKILSQKPAPGSIMRTGGTLTLHCQQFRRRRYSLASPKQTTRSGRQNG